MKDFIAVSALAIESAIVTLVVRYMGLAVPFGVAVAVFVVLALIGFAVWHKKTPEQWRELALGSVILGVGFFAIDVILAHLVGKTTTFRFPGGLLGLPLTFAIWGCAMLSLAGLARAHYLNGGSAR